MVTNTINTVQSTENIINGIISLEEYSKDNAGNVEEIEAEAKRLSELANGLSNKLNTFTTES